MTNPPQSVQSLTERFARHCDDYHRGRYGETQVRNEFINPLFEALGWDVHNQAGYAEAYKDVIHEDAIKIGGATKAPDYCFRIGGARKFFLEAKKPSVDIAGEPGPAYQLRRYAWSAKLPLSVLTDFEEFAVYDCRIRPKPTDKASVARTLYIRYDEYADRWDEIASIFSKEAVLQGSFDKYAAGRKKRGTAEVDAEFLREIEKWRDALARNIALRNPQLNGRELNFAVQRTIDRIIFLRICEDRGVETYASLQALINGTDTYARLMQMFRAADDRYNSGLFHFNTERDRAAAPDTLTPTISIDDKPLKDIFRSLYYPQSPYEFAVLPADILGNVYEQFLGKVIHLTAGHRARVEEKPEVKKAGGVYYTPKYIVDYIVAHTVGRILGGTAFQAVKKSTGSKPVPPKAKTPTQVSRLRILDPACGSGSFLVGAYRKLLEYHRDWYLDDGAKKHTKKIYQGHGGQWFLTTAEKKRILLKNIYGVDIDPQAVEVTKLNLLLCALENENQTTLGQLNLIHERALPDLSSNIKCGNSLIGPDFYDGQQMSLFDEDARYKINAFDWPTEFPEIFKGKNPGFDAVIGNPPWGGDIDKELEYFHAKYPASTQDHTDSFKLFVEAALSLADSGGFVSMIVPNTLLRQRRIKDVRSLLLNNSILHLVNLGENVFEKVVAPSCIFVVGHQSASKDHSVRIRNLTALSGPDRTAALLEEESDGAEIRQKSFESNADLEFRSPIPVHSVPVMLLGELSELQCKDAGINYQRVKVGMREKGKSDLAKRLLYEGNRQKAEDEMYWKGTDIDRYRIEEATERFCRPNYRDFVRSNEVVRLNYEVYNTTPKILFRQTSDHIIATIDYRGVWFGRSIIALVPTPNCNHRLEYFLGILNSRYLLWLYHELVQEAGRVFAQVKLSKIKQIPLRIIDFSSDSDKAAHDRMVSLVEAMLDLHKQLSAARAEHDKTLIQRQISATDKQIDKLVYELYGLTEEEIAIVEKGMQ